MEEKTIHRIDQIRGAKNLSNSALEEKLGLSNGSFGKSLKKDSSVKDDVIRKVLEVFPSVSLRWLVLGEGEMESVDPDNEERLVNYLVDNHERLMKDSRLYKEKMSNMAKDLLMFKYGHLIKKKG